MGIKYHYDFKPRASLEKVLMCLSPKVTKMALALLFLIHNKQKCAHNVMRPDFLLGSCVIFLSALFASQPSHGVEASFGFALYRPLLRDLLLPAVSLYFSAFHYMSLNPCCIGFEDIILS